jgi:large subunit ribosomal protein L5
MQNEFYQHYKERVVPALRTQHGYTNDHQIPKLEKVVINTSVGSHSDVKQALEEAKAELALITGQKPAETRSKKSISNFKLRKDQLIGAKVTLRGERMYEFMERLIKASLAVFRRKDSTAMATTRSAFPTNRFFPRWNWTKSSATSVLMLRL